MADILEEENFRERKVTELRGRPDWQGMEQVTETRSPLHLHTWVFCLQCFHQFALGLSELPGNYVKGQGENLCTGVITGKPPSSSNQ